MAEPNEVENEELDNEQQEQQNEPVRPKKPNLRIAGNKVVNATAKFTKKIMEIFAAMPLPLKIALIAIIAIIIIVVVILDAEASESTNAFTSSVDSVVSQSDDLSDEAKEAYEKYGSLIKFPIAKLLEMYDYFSNEGEFAGQEIKDNYNYILGTIDISSKENGENGENASSDSSVNNDIEGLVKKAVEMAKKGRHNLWI